MSEKLNGIEKDLNSKDHTRQAAAIMYSVYLKECINELDNKIDLVYEKIMDQESAQFSLH